MAEGDSVGEVIRRLGITKITYSRWRREYGGMVVDQAKRLKDLERENMRLNPVAPEKTATMNHSTADCGTNA